MSGATASVEQLLERPRYRLFVPAPCPTGLVPARRTLASTDVVITSDAAVQKRYKESEPQQEHSLKRSKPWGGLTGVLHDKVFQQHKHPHRRHLERPERISAILTHLESVGLLTRCTKLSATDADCSDLQVHNQHYLRRLKKLAGAPLQRLVEEAEQYDSVYMNEHTIDCARKAAGGLMLLVREVIQGKLRNGFAIIRPPGHHAEAHHAKGFCWINNVAVAAHYARTKLNVARVLIVDWDVHHGNGTQRMFLSDPSVLYFSVHRYDHGRFWPGGSDGSPQCVGTGAGEGYTVNVAWDGCGYGDAEYLEVWRRVLLPIAREFDPELVLVSAGFDGARGDDMGGCRVTPRGFAAMTKLLLTLAGGNTVLALEGGYKLSVLSECVQACVEELLRAASPVTELQHAIENSAAVTCSRPQRHDIVVEGEGPMMPEALEAIRQTVEVHRRFWSCLEDHQATALSL